MHSGITLYACKGRDKAAAEFIVIPSALQAPYRHVKEEQAENTKGSP